MSNKIMESLRKFLYGAPAGVSKQLAITPEIIQETSKVIQEITPSKNHINPDLMNIITQYIGEDHYIKNRQMIFIRHLIKACNPEIGDDYSQHYNILSNINQRRMFPNKVARVLVYRYTQCKCVIMYILFEDNWNVNDKPIIPTCRVIIKYNMCDNLETSCSESKDPRWEINGREVSGRSKTETEYYENINSTTKRYDFEGIRFISGKDHMIITMSDHLLPIPRPSKI